MQPFWSTYGIPAFSLVLIVVAFFVGAWYGEGRVNPATFVTELTNKTGDPLSLGLQNEEVVDFRPFWRVWNVLNNKFVPYSTSTDAAIDTQEKVWHAIAGLVSTYDDPYTVFLPPKESEEFKIQTQGRFEGIGAVIGQDQGRLVVVAPLENSPAMQAGLLAGDFINQIDGEAASTLAVDMAVTKIRGEKGTSVVLTVERIGEPDHIDIAVTRGKIDIPSTATTVVTKEVEKPIHTADTAAMLPDSSSESEQVAGVAASGESSSEAKETELVQEDFFVLRLFSFSESSIKAFQRGLEEFQQSGTNKLIIDLRGNPGGFLEAAVDIASYFLPEGEIVVTEIVGGELTQRVHTSRGYDLLANRNEPLSLVVLIDRGSASASEILAGALQEHGVATLIGEASFGKGSVQELLDVAPDVSLKVTVARWFTPNGTSISEGGLIPDVTVDRTHFVPGVDPILNAAVDYLVNGTVTPKILISE